MKKLLYQSLTILCFLFFLFSKANSQGVGINVTGAVPDSSAMLHVDAGTKGFLVTGTIGGALPNLGPGSRLMFYPAKAAFRAGNVTGLEWDNVNVGLYSAAIGKNTIASGNNSIAMGNVTTAIGNSSIAMGSFTYAYGDNSTAMGSYSSAYGNNSTAMGFNASSIGASSTSMGYNTNAGGLYSTAMGRLSTATGISSTAMGFNTNATGDNSTAMGSSTTASGISSTAMGSSTYASGNNSTAIGTAVSTNFKNGAFILSDALGTGSMSSADNEMTMGFAGGYRFFTNSLATLGVRLPANGNSWVSISDINRKENFVPLDGEDVLQKISKIEFTSWNYKQQDPKTFRHYGIMAQDFYKAFGHDQFGTIGNDTTVNPIDMIGIDMSAIQALEKRTIDLKNENATLKASVIELEQKFAEQQKLLEQILSETRKTQRTMGLSRQ